MTRKYNRLQWRYTWVTQVRREGGSLCVTIPRFATRGLQLQPGDVLLVKLTEEGIVLRPRFPRRLVADQV
jgi:antitoxin component of MazEF toxin-antitoxin module